MEKRIELEKRGRRANQIRELNLDNCRSTNIVGLTDEFTALESLSLINVGLTTLKGFPKLPNLKRLDLSDNRISNGLNHLVTSPKLTHLNLGGNKIKDLETLKPLDSFQNLEVLDLFNNEATTTVENYREKIFSMIPSLKYLDGFDANEVEAPSEGDDDDEVNGNDSDDEARNAFWINNLEIDLNELQDFEKRIEEKKRDRPPIDENQFDELDEYLNQLKLKEAEPVTTSTEKNNESCDRNLIVVRNDEIISNNSISSGHQLVNSNSLSCELPEIQPTSLPLLMYAFMAMISFVSFALFSDELVEDEDDGDDDDGDEESDVSLAEVYNDEIEEDNSDWGEDNDAEEDDDDEESEEEGDAANQKEAETPEESQARGKKRKHDG